MAAAIPQPHVLIFPYPAQGHINSMLKLAELLCTAGGFHVTFVTTTHIRRRLLQHSDVKTRFGPSFRLRAVPDGFSENHPSGYSDWLDWYDSLRATSKPILKEWLVCDDHDDGDVGPITSVISDGITSFVLEAAEETGIPVFYFRTISACAFWAYFCLPDLIKAGELPFNSNDLDLPIANVRGMEGILRRRDLPSFCRSGVETRVVQELIYETQQTTRAKGLILNTFYDLEPSILDQIRAQIPNIYTIGPIHAHLKSRQESAPALNQSSSNSSNSMWEEDRSCIKWLDGQPSKSVIYVSFGSLTMVKRESHMEILHGLVNSGKRFLWVVRPDSVVGEEGGFPAEVAEGMAERGRIVGWAPQEEVLAHGAIGGFFTHSGWNSTLESIVAGVPMICMPYMGDQQTNSRFVDEVWKVGIDMKDVTYDRVVIEKMVKDLMEGRRDEFCQRAHDLAKSVRECIAEGGTSYSNLDRLIEDIRLNCGAK